MSDQESDSSLVSARGARRIVTIQEVIDALAAFLEPDDVNIWMDSPIPSLHNATARQYIDAGDGDKVLDLIDIYRSGAYT